MSRFATQTGNRCDNDLRPASMTYPSGRVVTYDYGSSGSFSDRLGRIASLGDDPVASYLYSGASRLMKTMLDEAGLEQDRSEVGGGWH